MRFLPTCAITLALLCHAALQMHSAQALSVSAPPPPLHKPLTPVDWQPPRWIPPQIIINNSNVSNQPIVLRSVNIHSEVFAGQAQTRIEIKLFNPNNRLLEGELQFPLLNGQIVTGFALDVNGKLRDAVPVPKARGQEIFEDIRRRRVDPGLLEATANNQYKLRIYPIPAMGERRAVITVTETLSANAAGIAHFRLPLQFASKIEDFHLSARIVGLDTANVQIKTAPTGITSQSAWGSTSFQLQRKQWLAVAGQNDWLQLQLTTPKNNKPSILVGKSSDQHYFVAQVPVQEQLAKRIVPKHISLVWDASGSMQARNLPKLLGALDAYFSSLKTKTRLDLIVVRNRTETTQTFTVGAGDWRALQDALQAEPNDGSSNFDTLKIDTASDITLLATDGLVTDGKRTIAYNHTAPVLVLTSTLAVDSARLQALANRTNGAIVDCLQASPAEVMRQLTTTGWTLSSMRSLNAKNLVSKSNQLTNGQFTIAGELMATEAKVDVELSHPIHGKRVTTLTVKSTDDIQPWAAQQWATMQSAALAENASQNKVALERIAAKHGIVGPNSSLIVLELASDYARYELPAPPDLEAEVARIHSNTRQQHTQAQVSHLAVVVSQFEARQKWWGTVFPKTLPKPEPPPLIVAQATAPVIVGVGSAPAVIPPPQMAPRPVAPAPAPAPAPASVAPPAPRMSTPIAAAPAAAPAQKSEQSVSASVSLQGAISNAPYAQRLRQASSEQRYTVYLDERTHFDKSSSFYMDAAAIFFERGDTDIALRILSNLAELNLENRQLLRLYAYRLAQANRHDLALPLFERVKDLAPNEPQSWRDWGLTLAETNQPQAAVDALWQVVIKRWDNRFNGVNLIALTELNAIASNANIAKPNSVDLSQIDQRLRVNLPLDLRITMAWDTDDTDMDLYVQDPLGERASFQKQLTTQGGRMSPDATGGYGPEDYSLKEAAPGTYVVEAHFYGQRQQVLTDGTTVMLRITTNFGRPEAKDVWVTKRVTQTREMARIGEVKIGAP
jgi:Ca-activated chloride channel homolog